MKRGNQHPTFNTALEYEYSDGHDALELIKHLGEKPRLWQANIIKDYLATDEYGMYLHFDCGLSVPRQNGKNKLIEHIELFKIVILGRVILHSAHQVSVAKQHFNRMCRYFEDPKIPELMNLVKAIRRTNGQEEIVLKNGGQISFISRARNSGRGFTVDDLVLDEAQELVDEQMSALKFTLSSAPSRNPQTFYLGTPQYTVIRGEPFSIFRSSTLENPKDSSCWIEFSVPEIGDVKDVKRWYKTNPALGANLLISQCYSELKTMSPDTFARERLGWWLNKSNIDLIDVEQWDKLKVEQSPVANKYCFGIKFSADGTQYALSVAVAYPEDELNAKLDNQGTRAK